MGGDGGVIASNRRYLRGAGTATKTGDDVTNSSTSDNQDPRIIELEITRSMTHCALTDQPLNFTSTSSIVICPYGKLYNKEAAIEALLQRKRNMQHQQDTTTTESNDQPTNNTNSTTASRTSLLGDHIRTMKDLYDVYFEINKDTGKPICPVTQRELNGKIVAYALVIDTDASKKKKRKNDSNGWSIQQSTHRVNIISEKAIQQMGYESIVAEYSPGADNTDIAVKKIRVCPPPDVLKDIIEAVAREREKRQHAKDDDKKEKHKSKKIKI